MRHRHSTRSVCPTPFEPLEQRTLFAAGIVIDQVLGFDRARDVAVAPDGKIVVMGTTDGRAYLSRYNPDGSADASFGDGGTVISTVMASSTVAYVRSNASSVAVGPSGEVVIAGHVSEPDPISGGFHHRAAVARYRPDGSLDTDFGTGGLAVANDADGLL